jgi:hypothetical protein
MNRALLALLILASSFSSAQTTGDSVLWIPFTPGTTRKAAQVPRNGKYINVKIQSAYAFYKSGFLENIRTLVVSSEVALQGTTLVKGSQVQATLQKSKRDGDFIGGVTDHLVASAPTTFKTMQLTFKFRGIGEDRFKKMFDVLTSSDMKVPLDLAAKTYGQATAMTNVLSRLLASPFTSDNPRDILDVTTSYAVYPPDSEEHEDSLRQGFIVIVSGREGKSDELSTVLQLDPQSDLRIATETHALLYKKDGRFTLFTRNSYVVFSVDQADTRGEDEDSVWFQKYTQAEQRVSQVGSSAELPTAKGEAQTLWKEGNTLLAADRNFLQREREAIADLHRTKIERALTAAGQRAGLVPAHSTIQLDVPVEHDYISVAKSYSNTLVGPKENESLEYLTHSIKLEDTDIFSKHVGLSAVGTVAETGPNSIDLTFGEGSGTHRFLCTGSSSNACTASLGSQATIKFRIENQQRVVQDIHVMSVPPI